MAIRSVLLVVLISACRGPAPANPEPTPTFRWEVKSILVLSDGTPQVGIYVYRKDPGSAAEVFVSLIHKEGDTIGVVMTESGARSAHAPRDPLTRKPAGKDLADFNTGAVLKSVGRVRREVTRRVCTLRPDGTCAGFEEEQHPYEGNRVVIEDANQIDHEWWSPPMPTLADHTCGFRR